MQVKEATFRAATWRGPVPANGSRAYDLDALATFGLETLPRWWDRDGDGDVVVPTGFYEGWISVDAAGSALSLSPWPEIDDGSSYIAGTYTLSPSRNGADTRAVFVFSTAVWTEGAKVKAFVENSGAAARTIDDLSMHLRRLGDVPA